MPKDTSLGTGVTATQIKVGVMMIDFSCIEQFVDSVEPDQQQAYQIFFDDINAKGGINGRKLVPVFKSYCPINRRDRADRVHVADRRQQGLRRDRHRSTTRTATRRSASRSSTDTIIIGSPLTQSLIDRGPPGFMLTTDITSERRLRVIMALLAEKKTLAGQEGGGRRHRGRSAPGPFRRRARAA